MATIKSIKKELNFSELSFFNVLVKELQGLGLRVDLVDDATTLDAESVIAESGPEDKAVAVEDGTNVETVLDEADDFGDIEEADGMSIQDIDEIDVTTEEEA